jgi:xanthine dehydrogenase accessory factor
MTCHSGGTLELFIDPITPSATLTVVGDSPVARALVGLAPRVGLRVAVIAQGALATDFPDAQRVLSNDDVSIVGAELSETPFVVVATQGRRDLQGLKAALALQPQGLWFVSSAKKASVLLNTLLTTGEDPEAVARIVAPAGESIGAQTPEEIALSVLTSVVAASRGRLPVPATSLKLDPLAIDSSANQTSSCCDGEQKNIETAAVALATTVKSSCCGG